MTTKRLTYLICFAFFLNACRPSNGDHNFGKFTVKLPETWSINDIQGIDSYVKQIITASNDTIYFDLGYYSNDLEEPVPVIMPTSEKDFLLKEGMDISEVIFLDTFPQESIKDYFIQERKDTVISGFKAFLVKPKQVGNGIVGVYFDSIGKGSIGNLKLNLFGKDLNKNEQEELLNAIRTIKIKK